MDGSLIAPFRAIVSQTFPACVKFAHDAFDDNQADLMAFLYGLCKSRLHCHSNHREFLGEWYAALNRCGLASTAAATETTATDSTTAEESQQPQRSSASTAGGLELIVHYDTTAPGGLVGGAQQLAVGTKRIPLAVAYHVLCLTLTEMVAHGKGVSSVLELPGAIYVGLYLRGTPASRKYFAGRLLSHQNNAERTFWCETMLMLSESADSGGIADLLLEVMYKDELRALDLCDASTASEALDSNIRSNNGSSGGGGGGDTDLSSHRDALAAYMYYIITCGQQVTAVHPHDSPDTLHDTLLSFFSLFVSMVEGVDLAPYTVRRSRVLAGDDDDSAPLGETRLHIGVGELLAIEQQRAGKGLIEHLGRQAGELRRMFLGNGNTLPLFSALRRSADSVSVVLHWLHLAYERCISAAPYKNLHLHTEAVTTASLADLRSTLAANLQFGEYATLNDFAETCCESWTRSAIVIRFPPTVCFHELQASMMFYDARFSALRIAANSLWGCDTQSAYLVIHPGTLAMLRHAMLVTNVHQRRATHRVLPVQLYPLIARAYFTRYTGPVDAAGAPDVNAFMLSCFVETLAVMLRVKSLGGSTLSAQQRNEQRSGDGDAIPVSAPIRRNTGSASAARAPSPATAGYSGTRVYGLLGPTDTYFHVYRWLHRLLDVLQQIVGTPNPVVGDLRALNVVRAFLQLNVTHTISMSTLRALEADTRLASVAPDLADLVAVLLSIGASRIAAASVAAAGDAAPSAATASQRRKRPIAETARRVPSERVPLVLSDELRLMLASRNARHALLSAEPGGDVPLLWTFYELVLCQQLRNADGSVDYDVAQLVLFDLHTNDPLTEDAWVNKTQPLPDAHTFVPRRPLSVDWYMTHGWRSAPYVAEECFRTDDAKRREPCVALMNFVRHLEFRHNTGRLDTDDTHSEILPHGSVESFVEGASARRRRDGATTTAMAAHPPQQQSCTIEDELPFTCDGDKTVVPFESMFVIVQPPDIANKLHKSPKDNADRARQMALNKSIDLTYRFGTRLHAVSAGRASLRALQHQPGGAAYRYQSHAKGPYGSLMSFMQARYAYESNQQHRPQQVTAEAADRYFEEATKAAAQLAMRTSAVASLDVANTTLATPMDVTY